VPNWPAHVTGDEMVAAMDKVGVDGAIYISPFSMYQYDGSYAVSVQKAHPDKFALVKPVNPDDPAVADVIADWKKTPGTVGIRIIMTKESKKEPNDPGFERIIRAAVKQDFPVNVLFWGNVDAGAALIDRYPDARFVIDHMAVMQPNVPPASAEPWADLPKVVDLAKRKNAVIKISGACTLSNSPTRIPTSGTHSSASSTPGVSNAACGAPTGRGRSPWSTTNKPSSRSSRPTASATPSEPC
jgi:L-fuconolactonase